MSLETKSESPEEKKEVLKKLREFHQPTLDELGVSNALFIPKMAYRPYGKTEKYIACFLSEINKGSDVYIEFCSKEHVPEDPDRRLYKWRFNPHFEEEYEKTEAHTITGHRRYLIPVEELVVVKVNSVEQEIIEEVKKQDVPENLVLSNNEGDLPMDQMTIRDYAAIHLKKPVSRKEWLNEIIKNK